MNNRPLGTRLLLASLTLASAGALQAADSPATTPSSADAASATDTRPTPAASGSGDAATASAGAPADAATTANIRPAPSAPDGKAGDAIRTATAQADTPRQTADIALLPAQISPQPGKPVVVDENPAFGVKTLRLAIPPNKTLEPHGPRSGYFIVTVISGTLQLGFGKTFDESRLQTLPPGSVFTHPASQQHFARTGDEPVVLQLTAVGARLPGDKDKAPADPARHGHGHDHETHRH